MTKRKNPFDNAGAQVPNSENLIHAKRTELIVQNSKSPVPEATIKQFMVPEGCEVIIFNKKFAPALINEKDELEQAIQTLKPVASQEDVVNTNAILKKVSRYFKKFDDQRKAMGETLTIYKDSLLSEQKTLLANLGRALADKEAEIVTFQREEDRKAKERQAEIQRQRDKEIEDARLESLRVNNILSLISNFESAWLAYASESTLDDISLNVFSLESIELPEDVYMEYTPQALETKSRLLTVLKNRHQELILNDQLKKSNAEAAAKIEEEQKQRAAEMQAEQQQRIDAQKQAVTEHAQSEIANSQMHAEFKEAVIPAAKNVMKRWVFSENDIDMSLLPAEYHTFDAVKIKAAIASGARDIPGVRIYEDISNVKR